MWVEALMRSYRNAGSINAVLAELQAERERVCICNQPGHREQPVVRSPEHVAKRRAIYAAREANRNRYLRELRDRGE
jgi:hypothetical protein